MLPAWGITDNFNIAVTIVQQYNVITDGGATCNGVANDDPAFASLTATIAAAPAVIAGNPVEVIVPVGSNCRLASCVNSVGYFLGIPGDVTFVATGATITGVNLGGGNEACQQWIGGGFNVSNGSGPGDPNGFSEPFATVSAGASCVTLATPANAANYPVGADAVAGSIGTQINSFPQNLTLFEYLKISSSNSSTGVICFTTPLVNSYKSTWINLGAGNCDNVSCGSNGHLYALSAWSHTVHFIGGSWTYYNEFRWSAKTIINENMTFYTTGPPNNQCWFPTVTKTATLKNSSFPTCSMEADKLVDNLILDNTLVDNILFQSTSIHTITLQNNSVASLQGTPQSTVCNNSTITPLFISTNFGGTKTFSGTNCILPSISIGTCCNLMQLNTTTGTGLTPFAYAGSGLITATNFNSCVGTYTSPAGGCDQPPQFDYAPGTVLTFMTTSGDSLGGFQFKITDNSFAPNTPGTPGNSSGTFTINTSITGASLPPTSSPSTLQAKPDSIRNWTCSGCTGSLDAVDLSQAGAQNAPLYTYSNRTYTCANNIANVPGSIDINSNTTTPTNGPVLSGNFVFLKVNVTQADTTGATPVFDPVNKFGNYPVVDQTTASTSFSLGATIDLTHTGLRTITTTTTSGSVGSDSLTAPGAGQWLGGGQTSPFTVTNLSAEPAAQCPVVTVEWQVDRTTLKFP